MAKQKEMIRNIVVLLMTVTTMALSFNVVQMNNRIEVLEQRMQTPVHDAGGLTSTIGKVTGKTLTGNKYTIEVGGYGKFIVSYDVWQKAVVGDDVPDEVRQEVRKLQSVGG